MQTVRKESFPHPAFWTIALIAMLCALYTILVSGQSASQESNQDRGQSYESVGRN